MFANSLSKLSIFALTVSLPYHVYGHAIIEPALGVTGTAARSDVTRPSNRSPCGNGVNVANSLAGSSAVQANGNAFTVTVTNFNGGRDGSTQITDTSIDPSGTGNSFDGGSVTITQNGVRAPSTTGSVQVSGTLPAGTTCTGGNDGASCLVSFTTAGGFGNCVLVSQGGGNAATNATNATTASANTTGGTRTGNGNGNGRNCNNNNARATAAGSRLARSLKLRKSLGEALAEKRSWVWAS